MLVRLLGRTLYGRSLGRGYAGPSAFLQDFAQFEHTPRME